VGSSVAELAAHQPQGAGSIPSPTLHSLRVDACAVSEIQSVIERVHYSHSIFGVTVSQCYAVRAHGEIVGGAIFGLPAGLGVARKYGAEGLVELRRFVLTDECPRNSESRTLAIMLRDLSRKGFRRVLSYADPAHGHRGVIYAALVFTYRGTTSKRKHVMWKGKKYPDRNIHQTNFPFHLELRAALADGSATRVEIPGKHIWLRDLTSSSTNHQF
jgi:hypothetical protein